MKRAWCALACVLFGCAAGTRGRDAPDPPVYTVSAPRGGASASDMHSDAGTVGPAPDAAAAGADAARDAGAAFTIPPLRPDLYDGPALLSETGLYNDTAAGELGPGVREYEPLAALWSDGATKRRWLALPPGTVIDTSDMDDWKFPVGTRVWKEFTRDGVRVETRLIWKRGENDWPMVAFIWDPQQTEAYAAPEGQADASGTPHDVPDASKCPLCHNGRSDRLLGPTALQLSRPGPLLTIDTLSSEGLLSDPPAAPLALPGDAQTQTALAYLHANCGHCHNPDALGADRHISVYFWQRADSLARLQDTVTYRSLVTEKASPLWIDAVLERMSNRGGKQQMPPIATEDVDEDGLDAVRALMERLRQDVPALPPRASGGSCPNTDAVFQIFEDSGCRSSFCHGTSGGGLYWSTAQELEDATIAKLSEGDACANSGISRVEPGHPERSLLWLKLRPGPPCGIVMPPNHGLTDAEIDAVGSWIMGCTGVP
jgi:hypothetical protein